MLLTIYNLPINSRYGDIKSLIHSKCGFKDVILDNLSLDGNNSKKVVVGLPEDEDAATLVRKINGLFLEGQQLYVEAIKKQVTNQDELYKRRPQSTYDMRKQMHNKPENSSTNNQAAKSQPPTLQQPYYQQASYQQPSYQQGYNDMQLSAETPSMVPAPMNFSGMYGGSSNLNAFTNYGYPQQMQYQSTSHMVPPSFVTYEQEAPLGFNNHNNNPNSWSNQNDWNSAGNTSAENQHSQRSDKVSRWNKSGDSNSRPSRDATPRDHGRNVPLNDYGQNASSRDRGADVLARDRGRDASLRDRGRVAPARDGRRDAPVRNDRWDGSSRSHGRDAPSRDHGRDGPSRDHGRSAPSRGPGRSVPSRDPGRGAPYRDHGRDAPYRRNEPNRAPPKPWTSFVKLCSDHVSHSSPLPLMGNFSQKRDVSMQRQLRNKPGSKPALKNNWGGQVASFSPLKSQFKGVGSGNKSKNVFKAAAKKKKLDLRTRADTWRCQLASSLAQEIVNNPNLKNDIGPDRFLTQLKRGIRYRLEKLLGDDYEVRMLDMLNIYRLNYDTNSDTDFFNEVTEKIKKDGNYIADDVNIGRPPLNEQAAVSQQRQPSGDANKIPSYPQGDKKLNKENKKENAKIFKDEDTLLSQLEPSMQTALDEEADDISKMVIEEFQDEPEAEHEGCHERIKTTVVEDFKKTLKVNVAKRMLNIGPIMLRIFNSPKFISRGKLAPILAEYGVVSLRKAVRKNPPLYYGSCETYADHDKLCSMEPLVIDGSTVTIKPFQLTGQKEKMSKEEFKIHRKKISESLKNYGKVVLGDDDEFFEGKPHLKNDYEENEEQAKASKEGFKQENKGEGDEKMETDESENTNVTVKLECKKQLESSENDGPATKTIFNNEQGTNDQDPDNKFISVEEKEGSNVKMSGIAENAKVNETPVEDIDFTEDVDLNSKTNGQGIVKDTSGNIKTNLNKNLDLRGNKNYDDIDIDDVNEDDLEDW